MGSGSEVALLIDAKEVLAQKGVDVSVVSFPSWDYFEKQSDRYKVLPKNVEIRVTVEMGATHGWYKYLGQRGVLLVFSTSESQVKVKK
ncbi:hypothetical protein PU629_13205 [Pullulanibacillus sp. KACC 23026]|uniref:transketolase-like TK C-terminal-containing protein n=1 Tax=Pullulanibacillus sp. KACC 23026 TaxID=3028315 RepID=UPI0023AFAEB7|nr:hypothetical protein [Pullulanibacillus sp. KACC 23026]WEG11127.1 hypothetical protein PU629_13205 [Pullulanibacillus sp. KACC 23026]